MVAPMMVVVQTGEAAEVGCSLIGGDCTLVVVGDGSNVVIESGEHPVT